MKDNKETKQKILNALQGENIIDIITIKGRGLHRGEYALIINKENGLQDIITFPNKKELIKYKKKIKT